MSGPVTAALLTPRGRGAVATIRICGDPSLLDRDSMFRAASSRMLGEQQLGRIVFGRWGREPGEDVVVCRVDDQTTEIHCHGGDRAAERILNDCRAFGADIVDWKQLVGSTTDDLEAELQECLSRAVTWRTAEFLLSQAGCLLRSAFEALADMEWTTTGRQRAENSIRTMLSWSSFGIHLTQPWRVVLTGRPNVGKSSLMNALLGYQRSIVFDQPGTTRDVVTGMTAFDGWPVQLSDTAGLRIAADELESEGVARARRQLSEADLVLYLVDLSEPPEESESINPPLLPSAFELPPSALLIAHKSDLVDHWGDALPTTALRVSSRSGAGLAELQTRIVQELVPESPPLDAPLPITVRQVACLESAAAALAADDRTAFRAAISRLFGM